MKKFLKTILFLCALSSIAYAEDDAMAILNKKRAEIEKAEKAKAKLAKEAEEKERASSELGKFESKIDELYKNITKTEVIYSANKATERR